MVEPHLPHAKYEMGEKEQHYLTIDWNAATKAMTVELDGKAILKKGFFFSPRNQKFHFDVGASEIHKVEVSAGLFSSIIVLVDGRAVTPML